AALKSRPSVAIRGSRRSGRSSWMRSARSASCNSTVSSRTVLASPASSAASTAWRNSALSTPSSSRKVISSAASCIPRFRSACPKGLQAGAGPPVPAETIGARATLCEIAASGLQNRRDGPEPLKPCWGRTASPKMAAPQPSGVAANSELCSEFGELDDGVHVSRGPMPGCWNPELGLAHAFAVVNVDFPPSEHNPLALSPGDMVKRIAGGRRVEKESDDAVGSRIGKRVARRNLRHLSRSADERPTQYYNTDDIL